MSGGMDAFFSGACIEELAHYRGIVLYWQAENGKYPRTPDPLLDEMADALTKRIVDLESLLVCYRMGKQPTAKLMDSLPKAKAKLNDVLKKYRERSKG